MPRTARCTCGRLKLTVAGEPASVYACACLECQRATGSAFSYRARFGKGAIVAVEGDRRSFRRDSDAGRWVEQTFCPDCGSLVYMMGEAIPEDVVVSVGCFADPAFAAPATLHRASRRHRWFDPAADVRVID